MRDLTSAASSVPPWTLAVGAMVSVQLGSALSVPLIDTVGAAGTAWLRLSIGAPVFLALSRPQLRLIRRGDLPALLGLGVITGPYHDLLPRRHRAHPARHGRAVEFLGPLTVAAIRSHTARVSFGPVWR